MNIFKNEAGQQPGTLNGKQLSLLVIFAMTAAIGLGVYNDNHPRASTATIVTTGSNSH